MNKSQMARLTALQRIQVFMGANAAALGSVSKSTSATDLDTAVTALVQYVAQQALAEKLAISSKLVKDAARDDLRVNHMQPVAAIAKKKLSTTADIQALSLPHKNTADILLIGEGTAMANAAALYTQVFLDQQLPADFIAQLQAAVQAVRNAVDAQAKAMAARRGEHTARFIDREGVVVAEDIAEGRQLLSADLGDQLFANPADVFLAAVCELRGNHVRGQQGRNYTRRTFGIELSEDTKHAEFCFPLQPIAGFGLDGGCAGAQHPVTVLSSCFEQLLFTGSAGQLHSALNASAGLGDFLISGAGDALFELGGTVAGKDQVGVRVDEAGGYAAALGVDDSSACGNLRTQLRVGASCGDAVVFDDQSCVFNDRQLAEFFAGARTRRAGEGHKLTDVDNGECSGHFHLSAIGIRMPVSRTVWRANS